MSDTISNEGTEQEDVRSEKRHARACAECTQDPIFLFQTVDYRFSETDLMEASSQEDWETSDDGGYQWKCYLPEDHDDYYCESVSCKDMIERNIGTKSWETQAVFMDRKEARKYGQSRPYAWGDEGEGWRVYCVSVKGSLAKVLDEVDR